MTLAADHVRVVTEGRPLLDDVSIAVAPGELVVVVGPNGAGKSTLLATLAGDRAPDDGVVTLAGRSLAAWDTAELARSRAVMGEDRAIAFAFTAKDVALLGRALHHGGRPTADDHAIVDGLLAAVDATPLAGRIHASLSTGERQRVQLARALAQVADVEPGERGEDLPRYLLLDEPTSSLDPAHQHAAMALVRARVAAGLGAIAVLHDLGLAAAYADRIVLLRHGRVVADDAPPEVLVPGLLASVFDIPMVVLRPDELDHPLVVARPRRP